MHRWIVAGALMGLTTAAAQSPSDPSSAPPVERIYALDCAKPEIALIGAFCEKRAVAVTPAVCKELAVGDRVQVRGLATPGDPKSRARKVKRLGPTRETTGKLIIRDCNSGFVQTMDRCDLACSARVPKAECRAIPLEGYGRLAGEFTWKRSCVVKSGHLSPAKDPRK